MSCWPQQLYTPKWCLVGQYRRPTVCVYVPRPTTWPSHWVCRGIIEPKCWWYYNYKGHVLSYAPTLGVLSASGSFAIVELVANL
jgi:hypothetical protein